MFHQILPINKTGYSIVVLPIYDENASGRFCKILLGFVRFCKTFEDYESLCKEDIRLSLGPPSVSF